MTIAIITEQGVRKVAPMVLSAKAQADLAEERAALAETYAAQANISAQASAAAAAGRIYASYSAGNAATTTGQYFFVASGGAYDLYVNGTGTPVVKLPTLEISSGNLGIGTAAPRTLLHLTGPSDSPSLSDTSGLVELQTSVTTILSAGGITDSPFTMWAQTKNFNAGDYTGNAFPFALNPLGGDISIGTMTSGAGFGPTARFSVATVAGIGQVVKNAADGSVTSILWNAVATGDPFFQAFYTEASPTLRGSIGFNRGGGSVSYNTTSDYRAKYIFGEFEPGDVIDDLTVHLGKMNGAHWSRPMLVAHEVQENFPYAVSGEKDAEDADGNPIMQQVDHQVLVPLLISEIQALRRRLSALEP